VSLVSAAVALTILIGGCSRGCGGGFTGDARRPNVILIIVDTLRADAVRPGDDGAVMPYLSGLATRSVYFSQARSPSSWTLPTMGSLFLARYPSEHLMGKRGWKDVLPRSGTTLAEAVADHGYHTAALVSHPLLGQGRVGRGFDDFRSMDRSTPEVTKAALAWLDANADDKAPFFLYVHYIDPHNPYLAIDGFTAPRADDSGRPDFALAMNPGAGILKDTDEERREFWNYTESEQERLRQLYDGEARHVDHHLARLFAGLEERGLLGRSIVSLPDSTRALVSSPVNTGGLGPGLLEELDIPAPDSFRISAFSIRAAKPPGEFVYLDLPLSDELKLHAHRSGVVSAGGTLLVSDNGEETFSSPNAEADVARLRSIHALMRSPSRFARKYQASVCPDVRGLRSRIPDIARARSGRCFEQTATPSESSPSGSCELRSASSPHPVI
jgi:hypothetical protein